MSSLYLDHNAGSPLRAEALDAMRPLLEHGAANPSSQHKSGQAARTALELARERAAKLLGGWPEEWVFTSGATEACNMALYGACLAGAAPRPLIVGATEHPAVLETADALASAGVAVERLPVNSQGVADLAALRQALQRHPGAIVALMHANNETGVLHPVAEAAALVHGQGGFIFSDLAQSTGKVPVDVRGLDLDLGALSGTKFGGPQGSGLLYRRKGLRLKPLLHGGHQEFGLRPGTENVAAAVGLAGALEAAVGGLNDQTKAWTLAVDALESGLRRLLPGLQVHGRGAERVSNTLSVSLPGLDRDLLLLRLDQLGLQASAGAACAAGAAEPSHVLAAMGASSEAIRTVLRFSFGPGQGESEALEALRRLGMAWDGFRAAGLLPG